MRSKDLIKSMTLTILLLVILDIISTAVLPALGFYKIKLPFNILIILYLGFNINNSILPFLILILQYFHAAFSIEGWSYGTFAGVFICMLIGYLKELLDFSTMISTIIVTQVFQCVWFLVTSILIYLRSGNFPFIIDRFWRFLPESLIISIMSPLFFALLSRIWRPERYKAEVDF